MTILPRVATAGELTQIRSETQSSRLYMTVHVPEVVYSARVNGAPASNDKVVSVTYDGGSGTHTDILADQTLYVGTSAGAYDLGMSRIRNTTGIGATSGTFDIEITSEIQWADNAYLTVVDEFALRPRWPYTDAAGELFMDYNVDYVNQHRYCASFPVFPRYAVKWLPSGLITGDVVVVRNGSQSWALNNTINGYAWAAPGNSGISGDTTDTVTINYDTVNSSAGYRVSLTVSNTDGVSFTGYGRVFVLREESDAITQFTVNRLSGSFSSGGWTADITCYAQADPATIRDRALVILHRKDWYGTTEGSVGYVQDDENIEFIGWIDGETINWASEDKSGEVSFSVKGPQFWLDHITMPTVGLKNKSAHPTNWKRFWGLSAKSATWHLLMWRTTAPRMMDCFQIDNDYAAMQLQSGGAKSIWDQLANILDDFLLARPCCDAYARLFMEVEQQCLSQAARSSIPTVLTVTTGDWSNNVEFDRIEVNEIAAVDITGEVYDGVHALTNVYALCPGRVFSHQGSSVFSRKSLVVDTQATLNTLAGAIYGWKNNPYPNWRFIFPSNLHLIDVAPHQYLSVTVNTADTPRGLTPFTKRLIPREIRRVWKDGYFETQATVEAEALIGVGITGDTPPDPPEVPASPPTPYIPPDPVPTLNANLKGLVMYVSDLTVGYNNHLIYAGDFNVAGQPTWTELALPANFAAVTTLTTTFDHIVFTSSTGNRLMLVGARTDDGNVTIWECTNWTSIRYSASPPAPTWVERVVYNVSTIGGSTVVRVSTGTSGNGDFSGEVFYFSCRLSTVWSLGAIATDGSLSATNPTSLEENLGVGPGVYNDIHLTSGNSYLRTLAGASVFTWDDSFFGTQETSSPYSNALATARVTGYVRQAVSPPHQLAIRFNGGSYDIGSSATYARLFFRGNPNGTVVTAGPTSHTDNFISTDGGSTWASFATWGYGAMIPVHGVNDEGHVWLRYGLITSGNVPIRLYDNAGAVVSDLTSNWWTARFPTSVNTEIRSARGWYQL